MPSVGARFEPAQSFGVIESVKTASDLYSPAAGEIVAINEALHDKPELVNNDPYGDGWMIRIKLAGGAGKTDGLMEAAAYRALIEAA